MSAQTLKLQTSKLFFFQESLFLKANTLKNCRFYELILLDNKSTRIEHIKDDNGKVLYPSEFTSLYHPRTGVHPFLNTKKSHSFSNLNISIS